MASFVRESKLRQSAVTLTKKEQHYENLKVFQPPNDVNCVAGNSSFIAYIDTTGTGSSLAVLPHTSTGKNHVPISSPAYAQPIIRAHGQSVQDFDFNPFNQHQIYTCSTDKTIKIWQIPEEGLVVDLSSPLVSMTLQDQAPVRGLSPHPTTDGILAARGSRSVTLFDALNGKAISSTTGKSSSIPTSDLQSLTWSFRGDLLATTAKDKLLRLFDPRLLGSDRETVITVPSHVGLRFSRTVWLGDSPYLLSCGHNNNQERELMLWDSRRMEAGHVKRERVDASYGPLLPLFDADLNALVLMGKGDSSLRFYEFDALTGADGAVTAHALSNNTVGAGADVTKGACLLPKQANDLMACEVLRVLKLTENAIQPVSITVPRKEKLKFHEDLYPPTICETAPSTTVAEYLAGKNRPLSRIHITAAMGVSRTPGSVSQATSPCPSPVPTAAVAGGKEGGVRFDSPLPEEEAGSGTCTPSMSSSRASSKRFSSLASSCKFRHMFGTENTKDCSYFSLAPDLSAMDSPIVACNETYFAMPYRGGGGPVYVSTHSAYGKVLPDCAVVNGHKAPVQEVAFSPFHPGLMATGSNDATVKIWDVDTCFRTEESERAPAITNLEPACALITHTNSIRTVTFHPTVAGLLCSTAQDMTVRHFDVEQGAEAGCMSVPEAVTVNVSYNYDGSLLALAGKDRSVRIVDPRANKVVLSTESGLAAGLAGFRGSVSATGNPHLGRNLRVAWCCTRTGANADPLITVSAGSSGLRQLHLWDPRSLSAPVITKSIDSASGQLFPLFDETMNTLFLAGKGDTIVRTYEMLFLDETTPGSAATGPSTLPSMLEKSTDFQSSSDPVAGICMMPKHACDVRNVEVARLLKLTTDALTPISFKVPRADHLKAYFHDDLFPPVRAQRSLATAPDWECEDTDVSLFQPILESLQPDGMEAISVSTPEPTPSSTRSKVDSFKEELKRQEEESRLREDRFSRLQQMAVQNAQYNRNLSGGTASAGLKSATASVLAAAAMAGQAAEAEEVDSDDNWDDED